MKISIGGDDLVTDISVMVVQSGTKQMLEACNGSVLELMTMKPCVAACLARRVAFMLTAPLVTFGSPYR
jgi:hypothetical protein